MSYISSSPPIGNSLTGKYAYSRGRCVGGYSITRNYLRIGAQIAPDRYLVSELHIRPSDGVISHRVASLHELRNCQLFASHASMCEHWDRLMQRVVSGGL